MKLVHVAAAVLLAFVAAHSAHAAERGVVKHVVCIKFKPGTKADEIKKVEEAFRGLKDKIKEVISLEWGTNVSKENRDKGFTHCFVLAFLDEKDVTAYINHADHKAFVGLLGPSLDDVFVIDFHVKE